VSCPSRSSSAGVSSQAATRSSTRADEELPSSDRQAGGQPEREESGTIAQPGRLAQLGEHQLDKLGVTGSSPVPPTSKGPGNGAFLLTF
jgi:hypothetical protein